MKKESLYAISPIDGRYYKKTIELQKYFSESALISYRVKVEVLYLLRLLEQLNIDCLNPTQRDYLIGIYESITIEDILKIKDIERVTNHDVKAVEYFIKEKVSMLGLYSIKEMVHFALTSQDINNTAIPLMLKDATQKVLLPQMDKVLSILQDLSDQWYDVPMLARTHGQAATPTRLGREIKVYLYRLQEQLTQLKSIPMTAKFGGATGGLNAHIVSYPNIDWVLFANEFIASLGLIRESYTTQISNYDNLSALFDVLKRISVILIDFSRDMWYYISLEYFKQRTKDDEVGSSAMPHKVNPIDFENAEGNLSVVIALCNFFSEKLPISRLQRDLTDSTVLRNIGVPYAHLIIALDSLEKGLSKIFVNREKIKLDLMQNSVVIAEAIQSILRVEGYPSPYEAMKKLTRNNNHITLKEIHDFIDDLDVSDEIKLKLKNISPNNYIGI